ncbi:hypothetical protein CB1_000568089 [Camelus ferus]|nr:hypothetical protein CB1_000568089 [Camelus ferus]
MEPRTSKQERQLLSSWRVDYLRGLGDVSLPPRPGLPLYACLEGSGPAPAPETDSLDVLQAVARPDPRAELSSRELGSCCPWMERIFEGRANTWGSVLASAHGSWDTAFLSTRLWEGGHPALTLPHGGLEASSLSCRVFTPSSQPGSWLSGGEGKPYFM